MKPLVWCIQSTFELQLYDVCLRAFSQLRSSLGLPKRRGTAPHECQRRGRSIAGCVVLNVLLLTSVLPFGGCATNYTETYRFSSYDPYERRSARTSADQDGTACANAEVADASVLPVETTLDHSVDLSTSIAPEAPEPPDVILESKSKVAEDLETQVYRDAGDFSISSRTDEDVGDFWWQARHHPLIGLLISGADELAIPIVAISNLSLPSKIALVLAIWFVDILLSTPACEIASMAESHAASGDCLLHGSDLPFGQRDLLLDSNPTGQYSTGAHERNLPPTGQAGVTDSPDRGNDHRANYDSRAGFCTVY